MKKVVRNVEKKRKENTVLFRLTIRDEISSAIAFEELSFLRTALNWIKVGLNTAVI